MPDLHREASEAIALAAKTVGELKDYSGSSEVRRALITVVDAIANVARAVGIPDAVEPEPGAKPKVETEIG
jgi:hypothetical protein